MNDLKPVAMLALAALATGLNAARAQSLVMPDTASPSAGQALYAQNCAICHGANLEGQEDWQSPGDDGVLPAPPHDATGHTWHHGDGLLFDYIALGGAATLEKNGVSGFKSGMPGFSKELSPDQIWDILAFIKSRWPEQIQAVQQEQTAAEQTEGN